MKKNILSLLLSFILCTSTASAQVTGTNPSTNEERAPEDIMPELMTPPSGLELIYPLSQGVPAPFPGVLLNVHAVAWLEAEPISVQLKAQLFMDRRLRELRLLHQSEIARFNLRISSLENAHESILEFKDEQIASLLRTNAELRTNSGSNILEQVLFIGGSLIVGFALGIIVGLIAQ